MQTSTVSSQSSPVDVLAALLAEKEARRRKRTSPDVVPTFRGVALEAQTITAHEWMLSGPAETGKTWASCWRLDTLLRETPKARAALVRKVRADMGGTVLETLERIQAIRGGVVQVGGAHPEWYDYPNGARLYVGGMDRPGKVLSGERDWIVVNQAEELELEDWETLTTRCTGRGCVTSTPMLWGDCNPGPPSHWILHRDALRVLHSRHQDNPTLFDDQGEPTPQGARTLEVLDSLTGVRKERLRYGRWVAAEGVVYEGFDRRVHLVEPFEVPESWRRIGSVDFGYTNPSVFQLWALDPDGRMYLEREIYRTQTLAADLGAEILALTRGLRLEAVVADHDAEDRATLYRAGVQTRAAIKETIAGIQKVQNRLRLAADGRPRLFIMQGATVSRDAELLAAHKPTSTLEEFEGYVWQRAHDGKPLKEEPLKVNDHGMDALRYAVEYADRTSAPGIPLEERIRARVEERGVPVTDLTERHLAYEKAKAEERKKTERPRFLPTNLSRLRRFRS